MTIGSVGTGSIEAPGPISPIGVVAGAVEEAPTETGRGGVPTGAATEGASATPIPTIPDARLALPGGPPPLDELSGYRWPLPRGRLTQDFGPTAFASREVNGEPFHDGIDLATFCGDRIVAAHDGVVLAAGRQFDHAIGWVGDLRPYYSGSTARSCGRPADRRRHRRRQRLPEHLRPLQQGQCQARRTRPGRPAARPTRAGPATRRAATSTTGCSARSRPTTFGISADVVKRMKLPRAEIARIDPLLVLPPRPEACDAAQCRTGQPRRVRRPGAPEPRLQRRAVAPADERVGREPAERPPPATATPPSRASTASSESVAAASAGRASTTARSIATRPGSAAPRTRSASSGRSPASYSTRTSASARQRGWRSRIARQPSATSRVTVPSPAAGRSATASPRAQRAAWWSRAYSSRSA